MSHQEPVQVWRGTYRDLRLTFGPLPGFRQGDVLAYEWELPARFEPWPGRTLLERTFVMLDLGVSFANPCWARERRPDGTIVAMDPHGRDSWYVDLVTVEQDGDHVTVRDLFIDLIVPTDGRPARMLDLEEYADALASGSITPTEAIDGLRRWQRFLDRHIHAGRFPEHGWSDFPPAAIEALAARPAPFGRAVRWEG